MKIIFCNDKRKKFNLFNYLSVNLVAFKNMLIKTILRMLFYLIFFGFWNFTTFLIIINIIIILHFFFTLPNFIFFAGNVATTHHQQGFAMYFWGLS